MGIFNGTYKNYGLPKEDVLKWQKLVTQTDLKNVKLTKQQLINGTNMIVEGHRRIIQDCVRLTNTTLTPSVFFDRYDLLIQEMTELIPFEPFHNFKKSISMQVSTLIENRIENEKAFINKYFNSVIDSTETLKTQKAKDNRIQKFFEIMESYKNRMSDDAWNHLIELKKKI